MVRSFVEGVPGKDRGMILPPFDEGGHEYGRVHKVIHTKAGDASFFDFVFDKRTNLEAKSLILVD